MAKLTLTDPTTNFQSVAQIAANNALIEDAIEDIFSREIRRLNNIRERNLEEVSMEDIEDLKAGFAILFRFVCS